MTHTQTPLKCFPSKCDLTLSGHTVIAREGEAPYAYTCAGVGSEICEYVNAHESLTRQNEALRSDLLGIAAGLALAEEHAMLSDPCSAASVIRAMRAKIDAALEAK